MSDHAETFDGGTDELNEPVDCALEIALECARDSRVREHIRRAQQRRIVITEGDA